MVYKINEYLTSMLIFDIFRYRYKPLTCLDIVSYAVVLGYGQLVPGVSVFT